MNMQWYENIFDDFKTYWSFESVNVKDYRPRGDRGIRIEMKDGRQLDYDSVTHSIRPVKDYTANAITEITDERCRESFSYRLMELMNMRGFTQQTLAEYTGISKGAINKYLNKNATPSMTALRKISYALQCSLDELLD